MSEKKIVNGLPIDPVTIGYGNFMAFVGNFAKKVADNLQDYDINTSEIFLEVKDKNSGRSVLWLTQIDYINYFKHRLIEESEKIEKEAWYYIR